MSLHEKTNLQLPWFVAKFRAVTVAGDKLIEVDDFPKTFLPLADAHDFAVFL